MRTLATTLIPVAAGFAAMAGTAMAEPPPCANREVMTDRLKQTFGEAQMGIGIINPTQVLEVWSSPETGTWTILMTDPNGNSCMVAAGEAWKSVLPQKVAKGDPA